MTQLAALERLSQQLETQEPAQPLSLKPASAQTVTLRRTGKRPLAFDGHELCAAASSAPGAPFWYELNVYQLAVGGFVVAIRFQPRDESEKEIHRAYQAETFDQVMTILERYDTAQDIRVTVQPDDETLSVAELTVKALGLRARLEEARRQYAGLVGQVLYQLDS